jgi:hypothetical protein
MLVTTNKILKKGINVEAIETASDNYPFLVNLVAIPIRQLLQEPFFTLEPLWYALLNYRLQRTPR